MFKQGPDSSLNFNWQCFPFIREGRRGKKKTIFLWYSPVSHEFGVSGLLQLKVQVKPHLTLIKQVILLWALIRQIKKGSLSPNRPPCACSVCSLQTPASDSDLPVLPVCRWTRSGSVPLSKEFSSAVFRMGHSGREPLFTAFSSCIYNYLDYFSWSCDPLTASRMLCVALAEAQESAEMQPLLCHFL